MIISIINGPNLNLLGIREPGIYGSRSFDDFLQQLRTAYPDIQIEYYQSNVEGELINELQRVGFSHAGIILNPGGYTHTSVAIADAVAAIETPVIEVHVSNIYSREDYRRVSYVSPHAIGVISGLGLSGYEQALRFFSSGEEGS